MADGRDYVEQAKQLLSSAQDGDLALQEFEQRFLSLYSDLPASVAEDDADALDEVFWAIEAYVHEDRLRRDEDLDEAGLRRVISQSISSLGSSVES